jgi:Mu-like prophage protein gp46
MPGRSRKIDPVTRDYVANGKGGRTTTTTIETSIYHAFTGRRGTWPGDADHGSDVWRLAKDRLTDDIASKAENALAVAAQPFLDEGLARSFDVRAERDPANGRLLIETIIVDAQAGPIDVSDLTPFRG